MNEDFLNYLWNYQLIKHNLSTTDGDELTIIHPGQRNLDSGPDFFNGKVKIGDTTWAGNIEVHINSSDWPKHHHHNDPAYDNIILHVVYQDDKPICRKMGEKIPTVEIRGKFKKEILLRYQQFQESEKWIPCEEIFDEVSIFDKLAWLDKLMAERLEQKASSIIDELNRTKQDFQEVFYRKLASNFGFKTNAEPFEQLAVSLPLKILSKHKNDILQIEALLYGQAGLLNRSSFIDFYPAQIKKEYEFLSKKYDLESIPEKNWKFMRLRPTNFPTIRISQFAQLIFQSSALLNHILETDKLSNVTNLLKVKASAYWDNHFRFDIPSKNKAKKLGVASINLILINTIIPFLFVYGDIKNNVSLQEKSLNWLEKLPPERNHITRQYDQLKLKPGNAMHSQALIQLKNNYCDKKQCLSCRIGQILLSKGSD